MWRRWVGWSTCRARHSAWYAIWPGPISASVIVSSSSSKYHPVRWVGYRIEQLSVKVDREYGEEITLTLDNYEFHERAIKSGGGAMRYWQIAGNFCVPLNMKARREPATTLVLFITKRKCTGMVDAIIPVTHDPAFLSDRIIQDWRRHYRTKQQWPYVLFLPQFYGRRHPDTLAGAQQLR